MEVASAQRTLTDPTDLPEEVAERIFILLPVEDLLTCCLVNSSWRDAVNRNVIWKHHCDPNIDLENEKSHVSPAFQAPTMCDRMDLNPVCKCRVDYMREVHLRNNFRNGRYVEYKCPRNMSPVEKVEVLGRYLFLNDSYKNAFHLWDIEEEPWLVQSFPYLLQQMCTATFQTLQQSLLIVQCNLLQIYKIVDERLSLDFCRIFDREEDFSQSIPTSDDLTSWYSSNIGLYPCDFNSLNDIVGKYFIGLVEPFCLNDSVMHVWDLEYGTKLKEERIPKVEEPIENICCGKNQENIFIALYLKQSSSGIRFKIFCFNLISLKYTNFYVESNHSIPFMLFDEKIVLVPCDQWENSGSYTFLDSVSGSNISVKSFEHPMNPKALDVYQSLMVFGSGSTVTLVDLNTLEQVKVLEVDVEVQEVYFLDSDILLIGGLVRVDFEFALEVWDVKRNCRLYTIKDRSILFGGRTLPQLSCSSMYYIHILHFW